MKLDLALVNGKIHLMDKNNTTVPALGIKNGVVMVTGSNEEIKELAGNNTDVIDLDGKTALPGFHDGHNHVINYGVNLMNIDCSSPPNRSLRDILHKVRDRARQLPKGKWIFGWGYDDTKLVEKQHPLRWLLDEAAPDHPVVLVRTCMHIMAVNSKAMEIAGITENTPDPPGGQIDRDPSTGKPTGVLRELAQDLIRNVIPPYTVEELCKALELAGRQFASEGITSCQEAGLGFFTSSQREFEAFQEAVKNGRFLIRTYLMIMDNFFPHLAGLGIKTGFGNNHLKIGPVKMFLDGGFGGRTASLYDPYEGESNNYGITYMQQEQLDENVEKVHRDGYQLAIHAIGDRAIDMVLNAYEKALNKYPRKNHRHRIEHCGLCNPAQIERMKKLGVLPVPQPTFIYQLGDSFHANLGKRIRWTYPLRTMFVFGLPVPGSSDRPVVEGRPLLGIYSAVNRKTVGGLELVPEEKISIDQAVRMFTVNPPYASFDEEVKGTLEIGKLADIVILNEDIFRVLDEEIKDLEVKMTIIGGKIVYTKD